ncbi:hypothetical protein V1279_003885 [Bradyrhizobium sp. AZCC 1610]|uniref:hypothetical protein n=1 Tax=Bradyrhizobium sp. AZCC 1610 TaxID=3117020 RepID=UPI002FF3F5A0
MARKPDNYPLVFIGGGLGLLLLFHSIWNILFEDWLKHQFERFVGHTMAEILERFGAAGFPALGAIGIVWYLIAYRDSNSKNKNQNATPIFSPPYIYCETKYIKGEDGKEILLHENHFYLVVGNALETGKVLRRTQARIFHIGEPILSRVKETDQSEVDVRHGELALFVLGKIVSSEHFGMSGGPVTLDARTIELYTHNIPRGFRTFEVSNGGKRAYGLGHMPESPTADWTLLVVVSADDAIAMQVRVNIDLLATKTPVTCEIVK